MIKKDNLSYQIIDSHLHLPWQEKYKTIEEKYKYLKKQMTEYKIDHGVLIADSEIDSCIGNNSECLRIVERDDSLSMVYGFSPLERYENQLLELEELLKNGKVIGVKLYPGHEDFAMNDIRLSRVFELCVMYDVPVLIHTEWNDDYYPQYSHPFFINQIAEKYCELKIVCCHIWTRRTLKSLKQTMKNRNVYYDVSSFVASEEYKEKYPNVFPSMDEAVSLLEKVVELVPDRVMFGSDFGTLEISDHIEMILRADLSNSELKKLLSDTAIKLFDIEVNQ